MLFVDRGRHAVCSPFLVLLLPSVLPPLVKEVVLRQIDPCVGSQFVVQWVYFVFTRPWERNCQWRDKKILSVSDRTLRFRNYAIGPCGDLNIEKGSLSARSSCMRMCIGFLKKMLGTSPRSICAKPVIPHAYNQGNIS